MNLSSATWGRSGEKRSASREDRWKNERPGRDLAERSRLYSRTSGSSLSDARFYKLPAAVVVRGTDVLSLLLGPIDPTYAPANSLFTGHVKGGIKKTRKMYRLSLVTFASLYSWLVNEREREPRTLRASTPLPELVSPLEKIRRRVFNC